MEKFVRYLQLKEKVLRVSQYIITKRHKAKEINPVIRHLEGLEQELKNVDRCWVAQIISQIIEQLICPLIQNSSSSIRKQMIWFIKSIQNKVEPEKELNSNSQLQLSESICKSFANGAIEESMECLQAISSVYPAVIKHNFDSIMKEILYVAFEQYKYEEERLENLNPFLNRKRLEILVKTKGIFDWKIGCENNYLTKKEIKKPIDKTIESVDKVLHVLEKYSFKDFSVKKDHCELYLKIILEICTATWRNITSTDNRKGENLYFDFEKVKIAKSTLKCTVTVLIIARKHFSEDDFQQWLGKDKLADVKRGGLFYANYSVKQKPKYNRETNDEISAQINNFCQQISSLVLVDSEK